MKVNWLSPLPPAQTDIADYTTRTLPVLSRAADVRVWTEQSQWSGLADSVPVFQLPQDEAPWNALHDAQVTFYNIGNNCDFHSRIWQLSRSMPGIVVLHDRCLQHLFAGHYLGRMRDPNGWLDHMSRYYGAEGHQNALAYLGQQFNTDELAVRYPLTNLAVEDALGVLVHTREDFECLSAVVKCPVAYSALPYPATRGPESDRWERARDTRPSVPPYRIVLCGYLGPNRRIESILTALGALAEREQFRLDIYGTLWDRQCVNNWIRSAGLSRIVRLNGFVDDLDLALAGADLGLNLRYPSMGEASGTQLRMWDHALPSLVTRTGWYASLPDDCVLFVDPQHEVEDIQAHLRELLEDPLRFRRIGLNGRRFLEQEHSPEQYVAALLALASEAIAFQPRIAALKLADRVGADLRMWADAGARLGADAAARAINSLW